MTVTGIAEGSLFGLYAVSFSLVQGAARIWNFASAGVFTGLAYLALWFSVMRLDVVLSLAVVVVAGSLFMVVADQGVHIPLMRRQAHQSVLMLSSLTFAVLAAAIIGLFFGSQSRLMNVPGWSGARNIGKVYFMRWYLPCLVTFGVLLVALMLMLGRTPLGRAIRAYGDNSELCEVVGGRSWIPHTGVYLLAGGFLGAAAFFTAASRGVEPSMGMSALLIASAGAILGGIGNPIGAAIGGLILGLSTNIPLVWLSPGWQTPLAFAVLLVALVARPAGLLPGRATV
jgi:branched-subunit amino acid ABC-type transport system permease component